MALWGTVGLICPMCGTKFMFAGSCAGSTVMHHTSFGYVCGKECFERAELKYARMILGKSDYD